MAVAFTSHRVATHLENLEKSGNFTVREKSGETESSLMTKGDQEMLSGDSRMQENLLAAGLHWGSLQRFPGYPSWWGLGRGLVAPFLRIPIPTFDHSVKLVDESLPALLEKSENLVWSGKWPPCSCRSMKQTDKSHLHQFCLFLHSSPMCQTCTNRQTKLCQDV